jgi:acetyl esterase
MLFKLLRFILKNAEPILKLFGIKPAEADSQLLNPGAQLICEFTKRAGMSLASSRDVVKERNKLEFSSRIAMPSVNGVRFYDRIINSSGLKVRIYKPYGHMDKELPAIIYFHGGGFVLGSINTHHGSCMLLSKYSRAIVISVEYCLSPEKKFPHALNDALESCKWVNDNAAQLNVKSISVMGDSAGGNLAAVVSQSLKDTDLIKAQVLLYPVLDLGFNTNSHELFKTGFFLTRHDMNWFISQYIEDEKLKKDPRVSPLEAKNLQGLAKALIITAGFDPLRDDGYRYFQRLKDSNVDAKYFCYSEFIHGFFSMAILPGGLETIIEISETTGEFIRS